MSRSLKRFLRFMFSYYNVNLSLTFLMCATFCAISSTLVSDSTVFGEEWLQIVKIIIRKFKTKYVSDLKFSTYLPPYE